ncbi:MAG: DUF72 domain-containing protein [Acidobacteriota bacterium]|nr:DUF72 domain-containing protein [Acidobacteriota bacterium]
MKLFAGTSGYAYKDWKGHFYPEKIAQERMLSFYADNLGSVEINNTFYRLPSKSVLANWREQVPEGFRFVLKASRRITHQKRLKEADDALGYFLDCSTELGDRLGALLFQLPSYLRKDIDRLRDFRALLDGALRAAFEFRHPSWFDDKVYAGLADAGGALCLAESENDERNPPFEATVDWGYLRLRREAYEGADLEAWAKKIEAAPWTEAYVFFKHEDAGAGPRMEPV